VSSTKTTTTKTSKCALYGNKDGYYSYNDEIHESCYFVVVVVNIAYFLAYSSGRKDGAV
jgi:hypothetical protein